VYLASHVRIRLITSMIAFSRCGLTRLRGAK
jgi:hypothetical protein